MATKKIYTGDKIEKHAARLAKACNANNVFSCPAVHQLVSWRCPFNDRLACKDIMVSDWIKVLKKQEEEVAKTPS